jgi:hypothetical protein
MTTFRRDTLYAVSGDTTRAACAAQKPFFIGRLDTALLARYGNFKQKKLLQISRSFFVSIISNRMIIHQQAWGHSFWSGM